MRRQDAVPTQQMCSEEPGCNPPHLSAPPPPHHSLRLIGLVDTADMSAEQGVEVQGAKQRGEVRAAAAERRGGK